MSVPWLAWRSLINGTITFALPARPSHILLAQGR